MCFLLCWSQFDIFITVQYYYYRWLHYCPTNNCVLQFVCRFMGIIHHDHNQSVLLLNHITIKSILNLNLITYIKTCWNDDRIAVQIKTKYFFYRKLYDLGIKKFDNFLWQIYALKSYSKSKLNFSEIIGSVRHFAPPIQFVSFRRISFIRENFL